MKNTLLVLLMLIASLSMAAVVIMQVSFDTAVINSDASLTENGVQYKAQKNGNYYFPLLDITGAFKGKSLKIWAPSSVAGTNPDGTDTDRFEYIWVNENNPAAPAFNGKQYVQSFEFKLFETASLSQGTLIAQWWQGPGTGKAAPPIYLYVVKHASSANWTIRLALRNDDTGLNSSEQPIIVYADTIAVGVWHNYQIIVTPDWTGTHGQIEIRVDGIIRGHFMGKIGYKPNPSAGIFSTFRIKNGLYRPTGEPAMALGFDNVSVEWY